MEVRESNPKGVRKQYEMDISSDEELVVTVRKSGQKDVHLRESPDEDASKLFTLSDKEARVLGMILIDAYLEPISKSPE
ncbi:hypothetical protein [Natronosalvus amylolyticus]|uniref:hypothetical protein n=1 Tax=Natronosalvus amylolyticus TaxID=2961994 RepID=UPI0020C9DE02|nr:hypothetical protein [Natronosalvus amylolyticus]